MPLLFVYGSLKEGFPNFHVNKGRRRPGDFQTVDALPLYLFRGRLPCLLPQPGKGLKVRGQLFEVDATALGAMDVLERVGEAGGYARQRIQVAQAGDEPAQAIEAEVYMQSPELLDQPGAHVGPLAEYTAKNASRLQWQAG
jgi:gamma-glutamylaminecyclotransferase